MSIISTVVSGALVAFSTCMGFLPAARMSFMPGIRGRAMSGRTEITHGKESSTVSMTSSSLRFADKPALAGAISTAAVATGTPSL